jgi:SIR2-like domain
VSTHLEDLENLLVERPNQVLVIAGAGVSLATDPTNPCAGWKGLLRHGLQWCRDRHGASVSAARFAAYEELLEEGDLIQVANFIASTLRSAHEGQYSRWLIDSIGSLQILNEQVIRALKDWGARIATTNYDGLIEKITGRHPVTWKDGALVDQFLNGDSQDILHLHGQYRYPETVVLDATNYEQICQDQGTQDRLKSILRRDRVVFVGCGAGLNDPNFGMLLKWSRNALEHFPYSHYRLVRDCEQHDVEGECRGLPIRTIPYGSNYADLGTFLASLAERVRVRRTPVPQLELLARRQADYVAQRQELEAQQEKLQPAEYLRRHLELARELWQAGGHRQAALDLDHVFLQTRDKLARDERVRFGLDVAEMLLEDGLEQMASHVLQPMQADVEGADIPSKQLDRFHRLHVQCLNDLCACKETLDAIGRALPRTTGQERARLQAQRAEVHLLQGELDQAVLSLDD